MKNLNQKTAADKSAKNAPKSEKTIAPKSETKKVEENVVVNPEKEKAIKSAEENVLSAQKIYDEAKAKLADAKNALRKLTGKGKKNHEPKGPGVIATILSLVTSSGKKGISKDELLTKLVELFPDRASEGMSKTIAVQLPGRMSKEKKVNIVKSEAGCYFVKA